MPLPSSGPISLGQVATEFGISANLAACYGIAPGVPTSGPIGLANLHGKALPVGQIVLSSGTWTVPASVMKVSMVTIGGSITRSGEILLSAADAIGTRNDGGGNGGSAGSSQGGGGGAGGYTGNGGTGGSTKWWNGVSAVPDDSGSPGTGGGGKGGNGGVNYSTDYGPSLWSGPTAGVGASLLGLVPGGGTLYGGGGPGDPAGYYYSSAGANLRYRNNVAVTPGQVLSISGPCRIVWGSNRAFPSTNVGNL